MLRKKNHEKENSERWLLTYSDLITLLMIFFVVMYSSSNVDNAKYKELSASLGQVLGAGDSMVATQTTNGSSDVFSLISDSNGNVINEDEYMQNLKNYMQDLIDSNTNLEGISVKIENRGLIITVSNSLLFDSGDAELREDVKENLKQISKLLLTNNNKVRVEGHTDNLPIHTSEYRSNWQLSSARAANVVQYLTDTIGVEPARISAVGYGEYKAVADNTTADGRQKNRRVEIVILKTTINENSN